MFSVVPKRRIRARDKKRIHSGKERAEEMVHKNTGILTVKNGAQPQAVDIFSFFPQV
jgi:hypothetical protein